MRLAKCVQSPRLCALRRHERRCQRTPGESLLVLLQQIDATQTSTQASGHPHRLHDVIDGAEVEDRITQQSNRLVGDRLAIGFQSHLSRTVVVNDQIAAAVSQGPPPGGVQHGTDITGIRVPRKDPQVKGMECTVR